MTWKVGQRVKNRPELAHAYEGTEWAEKMAMPREGTILELPWHIRHEGSGTMLVEWDSLTGPKKDPAQWRRWMHSDHVEPTQ